ncbi:MAG: alcohol dehydrogenase catalytic domain-containing protein [Acidimicrobiia bacterium]|nr:alcohol dehydrogenase catalytic domain-containing protein [Acidimicrobiia bacterium]
MKAWQLHDTNGPASYRLDEIPTPDPKPGDVRVRLHASALNHLDLWVSHGMPAPHHFPHIAGADGAGVIDAVGEGVAGWEAGAEVVINPSVSCGACPACLAGDTPFCRTYGILGEHLAGTLAEYVVVPSRNVLAKPSTLSWEQAGAYGLATGTAYRMLRRARLGAGDVLLVVGVGGGVSAMALHLGLAMGATVFVTSRSEEKIARAVELGAAGGFDSATAFSRELKAAAGRPADVAIDSVGPATFEQSMRSLSPGGRLAVCGGTSGPKVEITLPILFFKQLEIIGSTMFDHAEFAAVTDLVGSGRVPVQVDSVTPFDELPLALERLEQGSQLGKVVIGR